MVASGMDALKESVHGMASALYRFLFERRGALLGSMLGPWGPLGSILRALRPPKVDFGALGGPF